MNKKILHEIYKKLILTFSTLDVELKQTRKIHDMIRSEFASVFTKYCYEQDKEFFENYQKEKEEREREQKQKQKEWEQKQTENSKNGCGINDSKKDYTKSDNEDVKVTPKEKKPKNVKKLYRKIAKVAHPDKNESLIDEEKKEHFTDLYKEATQAYHDSDMSTLIRIAVELGIKTPDPTEEQMQALHEKVKNIKIDIATIENTVAWVWYYSNENERAYLMQKHFEYVRKGKK